MTGTARSSMLSAVRNHVRSIVLAFSVAVAGIWLGGCDACMDPSPLAQFICNL